MKVTCESCGANYSIADNKVRGRTVKVRCKSCGTTLVVGGEDDAVVQPPTHAAAGAPEAGPVGVRLPFEEDSASAEELTWSVNLSDTDQREMTTDELVAGWSAGEVTPDAFVWRDGMEDWAAILEVPDLRPLLEAGRPSTDGVLTSAPPNVVSGSALGAAQAQPAQAQPAQAQPARAQPARAQPAQAQPAQAQPAQAQPARAQPAQALKKPATAARVTGLRSGADLFGNVAKAGSEEEARQGAAATAAAAAPTPDQKAAGARNENSVLFSLDALTAAPKPPQPKGRPKPEATDDPFGIGSFGGGGSGGIGAMTSDPHALLTAPPPPEPRKWLKKEKTDDSLPAPAVAAEGTGSGRSGSKAKLLAGIAGAVVVLGVLGFVFAFGASGGNDADEVAQLGSGETDEAKAAASEGEDADKEAEAADSEESEATDDTSEASNEPQDSEAQKAEPETKEAKAATAKQTTTSTTTRKSTPAKTAEKKEEPEKEEPKVTEKADPSAGVASFNKGAAITALRTAASQSTACKDPDGPNGRGKAIITFATSGRVTSVQVTGGGFGGTTVGSCIARVFRRARVPSFSGAPVTVSKSFTIP